MNVQDIEREEILTRLENLQVLHQKTLKELKEYDARKYKSFTIPKYEKEKPHTKKDIIINYVKYQNNLTVQSLVHFLANDTEYNPDKNKNSTILNYIRSLVSDGVLKVKNKYIYVNNANDGSGLSGEDISKHVIECLTIRPMTSTDMIREARIKNIKIPANKIRGVVSKMHIEKTIKRLHSSNTHIGWIYSL